MRPLYTTVYRYPNEQLNLAVTVLLVLGVTAISAVLTLCTSGLIVLFLMAVSYFTIRSQHQALLASAFPVSYASAPRLAALAQECAVRLQPTPVDVFVVESPVLNAYTFGLSRPNTLVIYSGLLAVMDEDEIRFVLGHEMGHVRLGHTWLNTLIGGVAGVPRPAAVALILAVAFRWWNRACEFSADRAGLLACGRPEKAISALVKLALGPGRYSPAQLEQAARMIEAQGEDAMGMVAEMFSTHPALARRINQLREYSASTQYRTLMAQA